MKHLVGPFKIIKEDDRTGVVKFEDSGYDDSETFYFSEKYFTQRELDYIRQTIGLKKKKKRFFPS